MPQRRIRRVWLQPQIALPFTVLFTEDEVLCCTALVLPTDSPDGRTSFKSFWAYLIIAVDDALFYTDARDAYTKLLAAASSACTAPIHAGVAAADKEKEEIGY